MVTYTFTNGTVADADEVNQNFSEVETKMYGDNTGGTVSSSTTETDLATITITQNDLGSNFSAMISAPLRSRTATTPTNTGTFRLYINGSVVKTISANSSVNDTAHMTYVATGLDSTAGNIIIKITGQNSQNRTTADSCSCDGLMVLTGNN